MWSTGRCGRQHAGLPGAALRLVGVDGLGGAFRDLRRGGAGAPLALPCGPRRERPARVLHPRGPGTACRRGKPRTTAQQQTCVPYNDTA